MISFQSECVFFLPFSSTHEIRLLSMLSIYLFNLDVSECELAKKHFLLSHTSQS